MDETAEELGTAVLDTPDETPSFPPSMALGLHTVDEMMASRYGTIVGILGDPESGKTACLVSLYLLVSHARLSGWSFADSRSLLAFEEIARGARRWQDGEPPDQMTVHTELSDDRQPGLLHLRLRRDEDAVTFDLFLPDLPGEWTKDLIKTDDTERFGFMKSADVIWLMTDGRALIKKQGRQGAIHRLNLLVGRLTKLFNDCVPRLILVPTHRDHGEVPSVAVNQIRKDTAKLGLPFEIVPVASFSNDEDVIQPGYGLSDLINATVRGACERLPFRRPAPVRSAMRGFLSYRRSE
ncbi:hypothetical protein K5D53_22375 [Pseudomonas cichorii]|nr:hypothetical protein [Pseudomonas cichorii]